MGSRWEDCTNEGKDHSFSREGYGDSLLRFAKNNPYQLFGKYYRYILFILIGPSENGAATKMSTIGPLKHSFPS
jgi:hypothetical protein